MRVRTLQLRLLIGAVAALWGLVAALVLVGYRPGGPYDVAVGLAAFLPLGVALVALRRPPIVRGAAARAGVAWLALGAVLLLVPSIADVVGRIADRGSQTLLPSLEAVYPLVLALAATSGLAGIGIARHALGPDADRRRRFAVATATALALCTASGAVFATAAIGNELALRDRPADASRFGPTRPVVDPPRCDGPIRVGRTARLELAIDAEADRRPVGSVQLRGARSGTDFGWTSDVTGDRVFGSYGATRIGPGAWTREPRSRWVPVEAADLDAATVDRQAVSVALASSVRVTAEDRGIEFVEGARARHCRVAIDGMTFIEAFPGSRWLIGTEPPVKRWRGEVDYWIFLDDEIGLIEGFVNGEAGDLRPGALQATLRVRMTATDRDLPVTLTAPAE